MPKSKRYVVNNFNEEVDAIEEAVKQSLLKVSLVDRPFM